MHFSKFRNGWAGPFLRTALVLFFCAFGSSSLSAEWEIDHFEIIDGAPWDGKWGDELSHGGRALQRLKRRLASSGIDTTTVNSLDPPLTDDAKKEMERFLHDVAKLYQEWGLPEPNLHYTTIREDGKKAFRVFVSEINEEAFGVYRPARIHKIPFLDMVPAMFIDNSAGDELGALWNGKMWSSYALKVAAHELAHAVQYNLDFFKRVSREGGRVARRDWTSEGQADALAYDATRILFERYSRSERLYGWRKFGRLSHNFRAWGARNYSRPLPVHEEERTISYRTSSFWRYLAELHFSKRRTRYSKRPGPEVGPVDYSYLACLLNTNYAFQRMPRLDGAAELDWLDGTLRRCSSYHLSLRDYFADFLAQYAAYGENRVKDSRLQDGQTYRYRWQDWKSQSFRRHPPVIGGSSGAQAPDAGEGCWGGNLDFRSRRTSVHLRVLRNAGACIELDVKDFPDEIPVSVSLSSDSKSALSQLLIGIAGEHRTAKASMLMEHNGVFKTRFDFRLPGGEMTTFVITNMAVKPSETVDADVVVNFAIRSMETNGTGSAALEPAPPPEAGGEQDVSTATRNRVRRAVRKGVTEQGGLTAGSRRRASAGYITIVLQPEVEPNQVAEEVNFSGLAFGGNTGADRGWVYDEAQAHQAEIRAISDALKDRDHVRIKIPLVEYGFRGTLKNAEIRMVNGFEPRHGRPSEEPKALDENCEPSGTVTIDTYDPDFLSGSFSAMMVWEGRRHPDGHWVNCDPQPVRFLEGRFWIPDPWAMDDDFEHGPADNYALEYDREWKEYRCDFLNMGCTVETSQSNDTAPSGSGGVGGGGSFSSPTSDGPVGVVKEALSECDCSCTEFEELKRLGEKSQQTGFREGDEFHQKWSCISKCKTRYKACY